MRNLTCFIASAFGYSDVDLIFDKSIKQVLKELNIKPLRVDRINHNDKIDNKIIDLINMCDFGIVDLTYARPSAYFEAGFIEGLDKKVIYISRNDHFKTKDYDKFGNEKIHFDLITKNIIPWTLPNEAFKKLLKNRIVLVTKPILNSLKISTDELNSKKSFESLSLTNRIKLVHESVVSFITKKRFKSYSDRRFSNSIFLKKNLIIKLKVQDSISIDDLYYFTVKDSKYMYKNEKFIQIFCSLKSIPKSRIEKVLRLYDPISDKVYKNDNTTVYILDSIDSILKLNKKLLEISLE